LLTLKLTDNKVTSLKSLQAAATKDPDDGEEALSNWPYLVLLNLQKN
jgi:Leucine-rich repeat (LRR) protein